MADKRITELNLHTSPQLSDVLPIVNSSETKKIAFGTLKEKIQEGLVSGSSQIILDDVSNFTSYSSSIDARIIAATNEQELSNYALISGGNEFIGDQTITGSLFVQGQTEFGGDLVPKTPQGATLGTSERPFREIYLQSGSISIESDTPGDPAATISNFNGNLDIRAAGFSISSGSKTPFTLDREGQLLIKTSFIDPTKVAFVQIIGNDEGDSSIPTIPGTTLQSTGFNNVPNRILFDSYGEDTYSTVVLRNAGGTAASPINTNSGSMGRIGVRGYNDAQQFGTDEITPDAYIGFYSPYGFASGSRPAEIRFFTTPSGSNDSRIVGTLNNTTFNISGSFSASLSEGHLLVGDGNNRTQEIPTSSFVQTSQTGSLVNSVYGLFNQTGSATPISASVLETNLIGGGVGTLSVPANGFQVGDAYRAVLTGHCTFHNGDTLQIRIKAGSVVLADTGTLTLANATAKHWQMEVYFSIRKTGTAGVGSIATGGKFTYSEDSAGKINGTNFSTENATTFDTTIPNTLVITGQFNHNDNTIYTDIFTLTKTF